MAKLFHICELIWTQIREITGVYPVKYFAAILWNDGKQELITCFWRITTCGLLHKTFFFVIYGHFAVNYGIFAIYEQIYGQNLAVTTNP